jgi:hypothetical protein
MAFDYDRDFSRIDFRASPELYQVGKGEQGVLLVEPYKGELLPLWRFKTPALARASSAALYARFLAYKAAGDFVGMDMARKFLQMGFTRARRYANHPGGRKYREGTREELPRGQDPDKAEAARIFYEAYRTARDDPAYQALRRQHQARYG